MARDRSRLTLPPHLYEQHEFRERGVRRKISLAGGQVSDVFRVVGGPVLVRAMFMEITGATNTTACNMAWAHDSDLGGKTDIGANVAIASSAKGDTFYSELDGTALVDNGTATTIPLMFDRKDANGEGLILMEGGIDVRLSAITKGDGEGMLYVWYKPLISGACVVADVLHTTTTSTSTTSSTTSSTASTSSTTSTTSSTASTSSTTSTTSSTASTSSTTSSTTTSTTTGP